jgi:hypothetical protein
MSGTGKGFRYHTIAIPIIFGNTKIVSASYAVSASHAEFANDAFYAVSASHALFAISASHSLNSDNAISASYSLTSTSASHALYSDNSLSASYAVSSDFATSASHALNSDNAISAIYSLTSTSASHALYSDNSLSASYAETASYINENLRRFTAGPGNYTTIPEHKFGLVSYSPDTNRIVFLDNTNFIPGEYLSILNNSSYNIQFSSSNAALIFSEGAISGNDGKLFNKKSQTTVTCLLNTNNDWELVGKLSF